MSKKIEANELPPPSTNRGDILMTDSQFIVQHSAQENKILKNDKGYFSLYGFVDAVDVTLIIIGTIAGVVAGICLPYVGVYIGDMYQAFDSQRSQNEMIDDCKNASINVVILGVVEFVCSAVAIWLWTIVGGRQGVKYRLALLRAILLEKNVSWFDLNNPQELPTKIATLCFSIQKAMGEKIGSLVMSLTMGISGVSIAYIHGWQLALTLCALFPAMGLATYFFSSIITSASEKIIGKYSQTGGLAEEALNCIRSVYSACAEAKEVALYKNGLEDTRKADEKMGFFTGLSLALYNFFMDITLCFRYFAASFFVEYRIYNHYFNKDYKPGNCVIVFFSIMFGLYGLGLTVSGFTAITEGKAAANEVFQILERDKAAKQEREKNGTTIPEINCVGKFEFRNVSFSYPSNPNEFILNGFSAIFPAGKTTAICGESGCGKSTILQLIEKFYPETTGEVVLDGKPLKDINTEWLRSKIGFVGQEPVLFNASIRENIMYGNEKATEVEIIEACKKANCYDFIMNLKDGLDTNVGREGSQLSGGEKQRIALARAIVRRPIIILLDEATSALDRKNEQEVQSAIQAVSEGITTIVIAHRLSTIKNADQIIVIRKGKVVETGTHAELILNKKIYYSMYLASGEGQLDKPLHHSPSINIYRVNTEIELFQSPRSKHREEHPIERLEERNISFFDSIKIMWRENKKNVASLVLATVFSLILGLHYPIIGAINGAMYYDLLIPDLHELRWRMNRDIGLAIATAFVSGVFTFLTVMLFSKASARIAQKTRTKLYEKILTMHVGWFDEKNHSPSALANVLSEQTKKVNRVLDSVLGMMTTSIMSAVFALLIGFFYNWRLTLAALPAFPLLGLSGMLDAKNSEGFFGETNEAYKESVNILSEAIRNIRTVLSFGGEKKILKWYQTSLEIPLKYIWSRAIISGAIHGLGEFLQFVIGSVLYYWGAICIKDYDLKLEDMFIAYYTITFTAYYVGQFVHHSPDIGEALAAVKEIATIRNERSGIEDGVLSLNSQINGQIEFRNVTFTYPGKKEPTLRNISFTAQPGQKIGIVGQSGSGKSTIIQLMERFYEFQEGDIFIDGVSIRDIKLKELRRQIGLVTQEPALFDRTLAENIGYGLDAPLEKQIEEAARKAAALDFIVKHPEKFEKVAGPKGNKLSGGEKQRIAIARAIAKEPKIMLLDEATSALDTENEKLVQEGLKNSLVNRTSIVVAHRLCTISDSDKIILIESGQIVEEGTHDELLARQGIYYQLQAGN